MALLRRTGRTLDGRPIVAGVYRFFETHGLPLDILIEELLEQGCVIDWPAFRAEAREAGLSNERLRARLHAVVPASLLGPVLQGLFPAATG